MMVRPLALALLVLIPGDRATRPPQAPAEPPRVASIAPRPALKGVHPPIPTPGDEACVGCHQPIVTHTVLHGPVAAGACSICHSVSSADGRIRVALNGGATVARVTTICLTCHEDIAERLKQKHVHAPVTGGACTTCHDPHGSEFRYQLPAESRMVCLSCHQDVAESVGQKYPHAPAAKSCTVCHDPHGSRHPSQTREGLNELCLTCHHEGPSTVPAPDDAELLFGRTAPADERAMTKAGRRIQLDPSMATGHPSVSHPVLGPSNPAERGKPLTCASCHQPHGAVTQKLFRFGATGVSALCVACHRF